MIAQTPNIKDILKSLPAKDLNRLRYAFQNALTEHALIGDGRFVGVNVENVEGLIIEERFGQWCLGRVK